MHAALFFVATRCCGKSLLIKRGSPGAAHGRHTCCLSPASFLCAAAATHIGRSRRQQQQQHTHRRLPLPLPSPLPPLIQVRRSRMKQAARQRHSSPHLLSFPSLPLLLRLCFPLPYLLLFPVTRSLSSSPCSPHPCSLSLPLTLHLPSLLLRCPEADLPVNVSGEEDEAELRRMSRTKCKRWA